MTVDLVSLLPVADRAAEIASDMMRSRRPAVVTEKHDRDRVSDVDVAIERAVRGYLHDATPEIGFLGEEREAATARPRDGCGPSIPSRHVQFRARRPAVRGRASA
ncbi:MAG TPA: hypothetical protein VF940_04395 [Streptosporangiaceae bacterium]